MKTIAKPKDNLGGFLQIWVLPASGTWVAGNVLTVPNPDMVYSIYCMDESIHLKEKSKRTSAGLHFNTEVSAFIPNHSMDMYSAIMDMEEKQSYLLMQDGNGKYIFVGNVNSPLKLNTNLSCGKKVKDINGYQISFTGETTARSSFVSYPF